ncbi:MAG TPA: AAA family ATPase [Terracidiphilus sp.]|nr:AAA family ATPase [Terracidiphilus sp.]
MSTSANQTAALALASLGLHVFPCKPDKTPKIEAWEQNATSNTLSIEARWQGNPHLLPAIPVGAHSLVVIDCDRKPNAPDGVAAFQALCAAHSIDLCCAFVVESPSKGLHFYWRTDTPYGNSRGSLPAGIDVRGIGGYVIAPGATLPDGRSYRIVQGSWGSVPVLPGALAAFLRPKVDVGITQAHNAPQDATERECAYAAQALADEVSKLAALRPGDGRNAALNSAAHSLGTMAGAGWIDPAVIGQALMQAASMNGHIAKHGQQQTIKTIQSGLDSGMRKPREPLPIAPDVDVSAMVANGIAAYKASRAPKHSAKVDSASKRSVTLVQCSTIEAKPITWLWNGFIPRAKLTLLAGAGGTGKSTLAFSFAGTISNSGVWPDGSRCAVAGNVLIWSSEDDPADTIVPRLMAVGANLPRCRVISGAIDENGFRCPFDAARDMDRLREAINHIGGVSLLVIDPIVTAVTGDMHKANDVRRSLQAIIDFAAETNCAVLGITHFAKGTAGKNSAERVIGSQAFAALARMVLVAAKEEDSNRRVFTRAKSNNSVDTGGFSYTIEAGTLTNGIEVTRISWGEALEGSSRSILSEVEGDANEEVGQLGAAKQFLLSTLRNGPTPSKELLEHAREAYGVSAITLRRAQKELGIVATKSAFAGGWNWSLPLSNQTNAAKNEIQ